MHNMQIRNPVVCDAGKVSLYKKDNHNMPTSERRAGRNLSQSDLYENKLSHSQYSSDATRKLSQSYTN